MTHVFSWIISAEEVDRMNPEVRAHAIQAIFRQLADRAHDAGLTPDMQTVVVRYVQNGPRPAHLLFEVSA